MWLSASGKVERRRISNLAGFQSRTLHAIQCYCRSSRGINCNKRKRKKLSYGDKGIRTRVLVFLGFEYFLEGRVTGIETGMPPQGGLIFLLFPSGLFFSPTAFVWGQDHST